KASISGALVGLGSSPSINVLAADGSGTLTTPTTSVVHSSGGNTITFTYTAAPGGLSHGAVRLAVPTGWSPPSTTGGDPGFVTATAGTLAISGNAIVVSALTLAGGATLQIVYGSTASGGPG